MTTNKMSREQISALADNELSDNHVSVALAALRQPEQQAAWDIYHHIGDVLRSDDMAIAMSPNFAARMAARLDAEPPIVAPSLSMPPAALQSTATIGTIKANSGGRFRRFAMPGMVAAAVASVALMTGPQLIVAMKGGDESNANGMVASTSQSVSRASIISASASPSEVVSSTPSSSSTVLRDPHIDEYLRAHQRFSPSVYSSAQFARSQTLAQDSEK